MRRVDAIHFGLMGAAAGLTYLVPFELLLLAYVVLGPAHYLTEISWLHDRKYFLPHRWLALVLVAVSISAAFVSDGYWFGVLIWAALVGCMAVVAATTMAQTFAVLGVAAVITVFLASGNGNFALVGVLLSTLIHVSLFTLVFMTLGAWRSGSRTQGALIVIYLAVIALILLVPPSGRTVVPQFAQVAHDYFGDVAPELGKLFGVPDLKLDGRIAALLAFVYTYHYLNWFVKAEVIRWADVPAPRLAFLAAASIASTGLYFYDYQIGFVVLLELSLLHVLLEFPLNSLSLRQLGGLAREAVTQRVQARATPPRLP
jgi:hypothetical protein